ncbi:MAG: hypothetical protein GX613_15615 [Chloroflexi bacterium]|nr:hypothetical protein [Chloroflexota bacterium]
MKRGRSSLVLIALLALSLIPLSAASSQDEPECLPDAGTVIEQRIDSASLGRAKSYRVYLLPNWCELENLPLLIMLHGLGGNHADWTNLGKLHVAADALIAAGEIEPLIILMPDADISWYISTPVSDFETYIVEELPDVVSTEFPVATEPERRFIGGLSMGGYGALYLGLKYPDRFSAIGAHSPALFERGAEGAPIGVYGADWSHYEERAPQAIILREGWPEDMRLFVDIGSEDELMPGVYDLFGALLGQTNPIAEFQGHVWPGGHQWRYWSTHAADYLRFYAGN